MIKHGVYPSENATAVSSPTVAMSGIPFVIGSAPVQSADEPAKIGVPVLCNSWNDFVKMLGYSDSWDAYTLCEFAYSHFVLFERQPVIFCNLLDPATMKTAVAAADVAVANHKATLPADAINDETLVVKGSGGAGNAYVKDTDYAVYYTSGNCIIETLPDGAIYDVTELNIAYNAVNPAGVTPALVATGLEAIEYCMGSLGIIPDTICAPGFSDNPTVAAVMAVKAAGINGIYEAKALIDIDTASADDYTKVVGVKTDNLITDRNEIACWPMLKLGERKFHMSTQVAGLMAMVDSGNDNCPYESPSNKAFKCDALILKDGTELALTIAQANVLNAGGVVTALGVMGEIVCWGNNTACYPDNTDIKDYHIPVSRMFDWVAKTAINSCWAILDKPMNRRLIDGQVDTLNIWLNGLVGAGYLLGGRVEFYDSENPIEDLKNGIMRLHIYLTPPSAAQEIDLILEYDVNYLTSALLG